MSDSAADGTTTTKRKRQTSTGSSRNRSTASAAADGSTDASFVCPECGKTFARAQALGAHRSRTHGVAGTSRAARAASGKPRVAKSGATRTRGGTSRSGSSQASNGRRRSPRPGSARVDRDQLLSVLFPNGVPAKASVITALAPWLDEAERLSKMR